MGECAMSGKRIIWLIVALLLIVWGVYTLHLSSRGPGDLEAYSGPLRVMEGAEDPDFGIRVKSPVLIRQVEMYQYVRNGNLVTGDFAETHQPDQKVKELGVETNLTNPFFPSEPKSTVFCGRVEIGDSGMRLSDGLIKTLGFGSYVNFEKQPGKRQVSGLSEGEEVFGLVPIDNETYATPGGDTWEIGDLRVTWYTVDMEDLAEVYTAVGAVQNGEIGDEDHVAFLFDRVVDKEDVVRNFSEGNRWTGIALIGVGAAVAVICLLPVLRKKKV